MTETIKKGRYERIYDQLVELFQKKTTPIARMATIASLLHNKIDYFFWTGFYLLEDGDLMIGPYQGSLACILLKKNTGVCWSAINQNKTVIVSDVHTFEGHIACDSRSESEIVVLLKNKNDQVVGVLDVDSREKNSFTEADAIGLEKIASLVFE